MPRNVCCVPGCPVVADDGVPLHYFPCPEKDAERFQDWVKIVGGDIVSLDSTTLHKTQRICRRHFQKEFLYPKNRLCKLAVPSLLLSSTNVSVPTVGPLISDCEPSTSQEAIMRRNVMQPMTTRTVEYFKPSSSEVKTKQTPLDATTPDFIPLCKSATPIIKDNNSVPKEKNGNGLEKNGQKRIQTALIDVTDGDIKKPRINTSEDPNEEIEKADENVVEEMNEYSDTEEFYLTVNNLPTEWNYIQIKNYLDQECGHVDEMELLKHRKSKNCAIRLTFQSIDKCVEVFKKLENKFIQDKKLKVKISDTYMAFPMGFTVPSTLRESIVKQCSISNEISAATRWRPDLDSWDTDPEGLYGLRPQFLKALGIEPPLNKMVHVANFRCSRNELKEVMELAGNVLMCCVAATGTKYAKVMYSHPLEAVQAISMLNGQLYYGAPLKITIDKNPPDSVVLPKGLANIGQGLGIKARPVRNIVEQYHRYAIKQTSSINHIVFSEIDFSGEYKNKIKEDNPAEVEKNIEEFMSSRPGCNILNPNVSFKIKNIDKLSCPQSSMDVTDLSTSNVSKTKKSGGDSIKGSPQDQSENGAGNNQSNSTQVAATFNPLVRPSTMYMAGPLGPGNNPQEPHPFRPRVACVPPPMQRPPFPQARPLSPSAGMKPPMSSASVDAPRDDLGNRVTVKFANLPPNTTFTFLSDLLVHCGQVIAVRMTTPGCAVATFAHPSHAEKCLESFNGMNLKGYKVEVTFA